MKSAWTTRFRLTPGRWGLAVIAAGALVLAPWAWAQEDGAQARAVRLSYVEGQVQLAAGNQILATEAPLNAPLFEGTEISTAEDGRAEIEFEDGSVARIPPNSSLVLTVLRGQGDQTDTEMMLQGGLGYFELQGVGDPGRMRVRFGSNVVTASGFTVVRIDLDNPPGNVAVFAGNAHVDGGNGQAMDMHGGESLAMNGPSTDNWMLSESIEPDSWDAWNSDRDQALTAQEADRTTATDSQADSSNPAWSDLDANGNWYDVPGQGYVWSPYDAQDAGWDPYAYGSWMWIPGYGYGWVSAESWGYLPYQYGVWNFYAGFGWGWVPGGPGCWHNGGWAPNVGNAPVRYEPPMRPRGGPLPGHGPLIAGGRYQPYPVVSVNRLREATRGMPMRPRNAPATIAGNTVHPLRPLSPRPYYAHQSPAGFTGGRQGILQGTRSGPKYGYVASPATGYGNRPGTWHGPVMGVPQQPVYHGSYNTRSTATFGGGMRPVAPSRGSFGGINVGRSSGGSFGGARSVGGGAPRMSGGGGHSFGGGGAPHMGGGGASHGGGGGAAHR